MNQLFVTLDFECFEPQEWQSMAIMVSRGPHVVDVLRASCDRAEPTHTQTRAFWSRHPKAFQHNLGEGKGRDRVSEEQRICQYVTSLRARYPRFYLLSDNPEFDIALLNSILRRASLPPISSRSDGLYLQTICTWSSRLVLRMLGVPVPRENRVAPAATRLAHTPEFDCRRILNDYLCTLDAIKKHTALLQSAS